MLSGASGSGSVHGNVRLLLTLMRVRCGVLGRGLGPQALPVFGQQRLSAAENPRDPAAKHLREKHILGHPSTGVMGTLAPPVRAQGQPGLPEVLPDLSHELLLYPFLNSELPAQLFSSAGTHKA